MSDLVKIRDVPYLYLDGSIVEGTLEEISSQVLNVKNMIAETIERARKDGHLSLTPIEDYKEIRLHLKRDFDGDVELGLECFREKTPVEIEREREQRKARAAAAAKAAETRKLAKEKREKTLYENLKKKFES